MNRRLAQIGLADALAICLVISADDDEPFERAAATAVRHPAYVSRSSTQRVTAWW